MVEVGVRANDLPGTLLLLADYYQRANALATRLKGLLVYPLIVIVVSLGLTLLLCVGFSHFLRGFSALVVTPRALLLAAWIPPILLGLVLVLGLCALLVPSWRALLRWRVPAFREASLAQLAATMALMLRNGSTLPEALAMAEMLEHNTPAGPALASWRKLIEEGQGRMARLPVLPPFPPLFVWLLQKSPEHPAVGFGKAAELYETRASYRIELALYGALPVSILLLGQMIFWQGYPMVRAMIFFMNTLGSDTGS
jgi:type II secretory pathway component PulF